jgi:hypothetical protein
VNARSGVEETPTEEEVAAMICASALAEKMLP